MVLPQQTAIYDYWRSRCKNGNFPSRFDLEPEHIIAHLPTVSLVEVEQAAQSNRRFRYRLAGTGFWKLFDQEIQGLHVDELPIGDRRDYWHRIFGNIVDKRRPMAGVTKPGTPLGSHLAQFWIRMPLSSDGTNIDMILGYDHLVKLSSVEDQEEASVTKLYA